MIAFCFGQCRTATPWHGRAERALSKSQGNLLIVVYDFVLVKLPVGIVPIVCPWYYAAFTTAHRNWVRVALEDIDVKRENKWTESIAVGSGPFIERIKTAMEAMAKSRSVKPSAGAVELRETQSAYSPIFNLENSDIATK
jgi:hypothetical protein